MDQALTSQPPTEADAAREWPLAVEAGDATRVKSLLASGVSVNATFGRGETALGRAAARGYADVVQILLGAGADVNARREDGFTPLILAVFSGHEEVVRLLLDAGADVNARTSLGTTAEKWAASRGFREIVALLRDAGAARALEEDESSSRAGGETGEARIVEGGIDEARASEKSPVEQGKLTAVEQGNLPVVVQDALPFEPQGLESHAGPSGAASHAGEGREPDDDAVGEGNAVVVEAGDAVIVGAGDAFVVGAVETNVVGAGDLAAASEPDESATVGGLHPLEVFESSSVFESPVVASNQPESKTADVAASSGSRFGRVLQSWPMSAAAVVLIFASGVAVFTLRRGAAPSGAGGQPVPTATGEAPQAVAPLTPPLAGDSAPQPSPTVEQVAQPTPFVPVSADPFPFTTSPQDGVVSDRPGTSRAGTVPTSDSLEVVSESGGARPPEGESSRGRAAEAATRETTPAGEASRTSREDERADEGSSQGAASRGTQRTGAETRRMTTAPQPQPALVTPPPAPTATPPRKKVIQWP